MLLENLEKRLLDGLGPESVAVVIRMNSVNGSVVVFRSSIGCLDVVDILILLACFLHKLLCHLELCCLVLLVCLIEVSSFTIDGLLENERNLRMSCSELLDEWEESLVDHLCIRIGECIKYESIYLGVAEDVSEILLELAVAAAAEAEHLDAGIS